jgi:multidrug efflux pump
MVNTGKGTIFFNDTDPQFLTVSVSGRGNFSASEVDKLVRRVEQRVFSVPGIRSMNTRTLLPGSSGGGPDAVADRIGVVFIELTPESDRSESGFDVIRIIRERTLDLPGLRVEVQPVEQGPSNGKPIQIELRSRYRELLKPAMAELRGYLDTLPELIDIDDTRALPSIEWRMEGRPRSSGDLWRRCHHLRRCITTGYQWGERSLNTVHLVRMMRWTSVPDIRANTAA